MCGCFVLYVNVCMWGWGRGWEEEFVFHVECVLIPTHCTGACVICVCSFYTTAMAHLTFKSVKKKVTEVEYHSEGHSLHTMHTDTHTHTVPCCVCSSELKKELQQKEKKLSWEEWWNVMKKASLLLLSSDSVQTVALMPTCPTHV